MSSSDVDRVNQLISNAASQHVRSPVSVQTQNIAINLDRVIIALKISEGIDKPYFDHQGIIWLKNGTDKRRVNSKEELRRLFQEVDLIHADEIPTRAEIDAFNHSLFAEFLQRSYEEHFPQSLPERMRLLENMNLAKGAYLNLAGLLLFGSKPQVYKPEHIIKSVSFAGTKVTDSYLDSEDFGGTLSQMFQGALAFIMRNLRKIQGKQGVNSIGQPEIPSIVFEELLVNALVHKDYLIASPIRVFVFEDRIEIINPGSLANHLTIAKIKAGNSIQRNPILASFVAKGLHLHFDYLQKKRCLA